MDQKKIDHLHPMDHFKPSQSVKEKDLKILNPFLGKTDLKNTTIGHFFCQILSILVVFSLFTPFVGQKGTLFLLSNNYALKFMSPPFEGAI